MSIELKIKSKHLALEPAIIRKEEKKLLKRIKNHIHHHQINSANLDWLVMYEDYPELYKIHEKYASLYSHRSTVVRYEARATHLARAYLKGMPYKVVESKTRDDGLCNAVSSSLVRMVMKYGTTRYNSDVDRSVVPFKVIKTAEAKAWEDIKKWLEQ